MLIGDALSRMSCALYKGTFGLIGNGYDSRTTPVGALPDVTVSAPDGLFHWARAQCSEILWRSKLGRGQPNASRKERLSRLGAPHSGNQIRCEVRFVNVHERSWISRCTGSAKHSANEDDGNISSSGAKFLHRCTPPSKGIEVSLTITSEASQGHADDSRPLDTAPTTSITPALISRS